MRSLPQFIPLTGKLGTVCSRRRAAVDPKTNPFAPGAGTPPPELAGRDDILSGAEVALHRTFNGRPARGHLLLGLRGVGKTVLLNRIARSAEELGYSTVVLEAPEGKRLAETLVPPLRTRLVQLSRSERARAKAQRALSLLRAFAATFKISVGDVEFGVAPAVGEADSGFLENDLPEVFLALGQAAKAAGAGVALLIDEVQYLSNSDLSALIASLHRVTQQGLPLILFGAGLPQLAALAGEAKSYAERLFEYPEVGALAPDAAKDAIRVPVERGSLDRRRGPRTDLRDDAGVPLFPAGVGLPRLGNGVRFADFPRRREASDGSSAPLPRPELLSRTV